MLDSHRDAACDKRDGVSHRRVRSEIEDERAEDAIAACHACIEHGIRGKSKSLACELVERERCSGEAQRGEERVQRRVIVCGAEKDRGVGGVHVATVRAPRIMRPTTGVRAGSDHRAASIGQLCAELTLWYCRPFHATALPRAVAARQMYRYAAAPSGKNTA